MFILSPNVALGVLATGIAAVAVEFVRPGWVIPAVGGSLLVVFGLHSLGQYPLDPRGLALVSAGFVFCALEGWFQAKGWLAVAAAVTLFAGSVRLVAEGENSPRIHPAMALATTLPVTVLLTALGTLAWRARRNKRNTIF